MSHIFISYSKKNKDYARKLADHLIASGFDVWIDDRIDYGSEWEEAIQKAIEACAAFLIIMTPEARESKWVKRECQFAESRGKPQFPMLLSGDVFFRYGTTQYADVTDQALPPDTFLDELAEHAPRRIEAGEDITPPEVGEAETSSPPSTVVMHDAPLESSSAQSLQASMSEVRKPGGRRSLNSSRVVRNSAVLAATVLVIGGAVLIWALTPKSGSIVSNSPTETQEVLLFTPPPAGWQTSALPLISGSYERAFGEAGPNDVFYFTGNERDLVTITMTPFSEGDFDPLLELYYFDDLINPIERVTDTGAGNSARIPTYSLPSRGTYYIRALHSGAYTPASSGRYLMTLDRVRNAPTPSLQG